MVLAGAWEAAWEAAWVIARSEEWALFTLPVGVSAWDLCGVFVLGQSDPGHAVFHDDREIPVVGGAVVGGAEHAEILHAGAAALGPRLDVVEFAVFGRSGAPGLEATTVAGADGRLHGLGWISPGSAVVKDLAVAAQHDRDEVEFREPLA